MCIAAVSDHGFTTASLSGEVRDFDAGAIHGHLDVAEWIGRHGFGDTSRSHSSRGYSVENVLICGVNTEGDVFGQLDGR